LCRNIIITILYRIDIIAIVHVVLDSTGTMIRILLVDFTKAFDRIDHHTQLVSLGLPNFVIKWLTSF